jgi:hypothetical protein
LITIEINGKKFNLLTEEDIRNLVDTVFEKVCKAQKLQEAVQTANATGRVVNLEKEETKEIAKKSKMNELLEEME